MIVFLRSGPRLDALHAASSPQRSPGLDVPFSESSCCWAASSWLGMGIVGQYIARIFEETKQRPLYLIEEIVERGETLLNAPATTATSLVR